MTGRTRRPAPRGGARAARTRRAAPKTVRVNGCLKVRIRGRDDAPLSIAQLREGLYELIRKLDGYAGDYRARQASLYLTIVDRDGCEVSLSASGEWTIRPYQCAADAMDDGQADRAGRALETEERP